MSIASRFGLSEEYWGRLGEEERALYQRINPLPQSTYRVDNHVSHIEKQLEELANDAKRLGGVFELNPDFQRGHVWDKPRQVAYLENFVRGLAPAELRFNCAAWNGPARPGCDLNPSDIVCVDGLQRITALRAFMKDEIQVFGGLRASDLSGTCFSPARMRWSMQVYELQTRADLLQFYLDLNSGGVPHTQEELDRVRALREEASTRPGSKPAPRRRAS